MSQKIRGEMTKQRCESSRNKHVIRTFTRTTATANDGRVWLAPRAGQGTGEEMKHQ